MLIFPQQEILSRNEKIWITDREIETAYRRCTVKPLIFQYHKNGLFETGQWRFYNQICNGDSSPEDKKANAEEARMFWSNIWNQPDNHNGAAVWLKKMNEEVMGERQPDL